MPDGTDQTSTKPTRQLGSDRSLATPDLDRLGYARFAEAIADSLSKAVPTEGLVLAIFGPWGAGKSTVLNFIEYDLSTRSMPDPIRFNPWWFSGQEALTRNFLIQLGLALEERKILDSKLVARLGDMADELSDSPLKGAFLVKALRRSSRKLKDLPALRREIAEKLVEKKQRLFVFVDDVDRLTGEEIRQLFGVIKAVADFPYITYVLAFDREVVSSALADVQGVGDASRDYIDKIVQVPFDLPMPDRTALRQMFLGEVNAILATESPARIDRDRWAQVYWAGIDDFIQTPRDVVRFANSLSVTYPAVAGLVNPIDFVAVEGLRVFVPVLYDRIRASKDRFAGGTNAIGGVFGGEDDALNTLRAFHDALRATLPSGGRSDGASSLVEALFPKVAAAYGAPTPGTYMETEWRRGLRVCSPDIFDIYFRLGVSTGEISPVEIKTLLTSSVQPGRVGAYLQELSRSEEPQMAQQAVDRIADFVDTDELPPPNAAQIVREVFEVADEVIEAIPESADIFDFGVDVSLGRLVRQLLAHREQQERFELLRDAVSSGEAFYFAVRETSILSSEHEDRSSTPESNAVVSKEQASQLQSIMVERIKEDAKEGLSRRPELAYILYRWKEWGDQDEVRRWVSSLVESEDGLVDLLRGFANTVRTLATGADGESKRSSRTVLDPNTLEPFIDPETLRDRVEVLATDSAHEDVRTVAATFLRDLGIRKQGLDPSEAD